MAEAVRLRDLTFERLASATFDVANWSGDSGTWVQKTLTFTGVNYTLPAGNGPEVKVIVDSLADKDMLHAYNTTAYQSRLGIP